MIFIDDGRWYKKTNCNIFNIHRKLLCVLQAVCKSIAFDFLPECDKHFFICTDKELDDYKCVRGKVTQYVIDDMPFPYITLLRYKIFNEQINDAINDYDYVFFLNSNARCFTQITCSDINLENDYTFTLHDNHLDESVDEKPFERNAISTACFPNHGLILNMLVVDFSEQNQASSKRCFWHWKKMWKQTLKMILSQHGGTRVI